ncbi:polyprotein [Cucumis melo var. makuwa]|uniref:Polyprotein n=1 Tax=Cucumis melo var. makuwa TaxID=1194695 RepID=A0A5D3DBQ3_CUCMM|nr:polyprotein [Cucumis melo var. makuwa]
MKLDKKETLTPSERSGLPRVDPNRPIMQPNSLDIKLKGSSTDELLEELTRKLSETSISKENIGTSSKREVSNFGMGNLNTISYDSLKILPIKVYNTNMKNHYKKPSPPDLGWDDLRPDFRSFDKNNIETWNIDGCSEGQMAIIFQEMFVAATSYLRRMSQREIVDALTTGFTGNLRSWWHNHLTDENREAIKDAVLEKNGTRP